VSASLLIFLYRPSLTVSVASDLHNLEGVLNSFYDDVDAM